MIICLTGLAGSGKDTVAMLLNELIHDSKIISISDSLKQIVALMCDVDIELLKGKSPESRKWREKYNYEMSQVFGNELMTPREILCKISDAYRKQFGETIFMNILFKKHLTKDLAKVFIIPDLRYYSDYLYLREIDEVIVINVKRNIPYWYNTAYKYNTNKDKDKLLPVCLKDVHISERDLIGRVKFNYEINNDSTLECLKFKVIQIYSINSISDI